jgi:hypothetical protein
MSREEGAFLSRVYFAFVLLLLFFFLFFLFFSFFFDDQPSFSFLVLLSSFIHPHISTTSAADDFYGL